MDSNFIITSVYDENSYHEIDEMLKDGTWINSITNESKAKSLYQEKTFVTEQNIDDLFLMKTKDDFTFYSFCVPYSNTKVIVSKLEKGDFFRIHNESIMIGSYKTHVFLNEPEEYEGGELCIFNDGRELKFKLKKGLALTYKTNTLSKINEVTEGEKIYASYFTKSLFKDDKIRELYSKILYLNTKFENKPIVETYEDALEDPNFILNDIKDFLLYNHSILNLD